ncbi:MAG: aspartic peptidase domain-containing protein [Monoraphidium minutum]|nr:MAG: aspartic peptidase domain-containing protein [Monoraphidium minutum]
MRPSRPRGAEAGRLLVTAALLLAAACAAAAAGADVHKAAVGAGGAWAALPLSFHAGAPPPRQRGARSLLRARKSEVRGSVNGGYYSATLLVGTPPQAFDLVLDTGSSTTQMTCATCTSCGRHKQRRYNHRASATAVPVPCGGATCAAAPNKFSCDAGRCAYKEAYKEGSSTQGWLVRDVVSLPGSKGASGTTDVGCVEKETGYIYEQEADGIMGLGNAARALPFQLARSGNVSSMFALCFAFPHGGVLTFGDAPLPPNTGPLSWTPLQPSPAHYYTLAMQGIDLSSEVDSTPAFEFVGLGMDITRVPAGRLVGFRELPVSSRDFSVGYGTVLDSGANFNYLPSRALAELVKALEAEMNAKGRKMWTGGVMNDHCWLIDEAPADSPEAWAAVYRLFPVLRLRFASGAALLLPPRRYLFALSNQDFCLGFFDNASDGAIIGGISVRDMLMIYDLERQQIGMAEADCGKMEALGGAIGGGGGGRPATGGAGAQGGPSGAGGGPVLVSGRTGLPQPAVGQPAAARAPPAAPPASPPPGAPRARGRTG